MTKAAPPETLTSKLADLNPILAELGLPQIEAVNPTDCIPQEVNARYMPPEMLDNLASNIKKDKRLESMPLCYRIEGKPGKFGIISGHHRIEGAKKAGIAIILILVVEVKDQADIVKRQLSHNALNGRDDEVLLTKLFASLDSMDDKFYAGLQDEIAKINPIALSFRAGLAAEMTLVFMPEDIERHDDFMERLNADVKSGGSAAVLRVVSLECYPRYLDLLRKVKKAENIKNNAAAFIRMLDLAEAQLTHQAAQAQQPEATDD